MAQVIKLFEDYTIKGLENQVNAFFATFDKSGVGNLSGLPLVFSENFFSFQSSHFLPIVPPVTVFKVIMDVFYNREQAETFMQNTLNTLTGQGFTIDFTICSANGTGNLYLAFIQYF